MDFDFLQQGAMLAPMAGVTDMPFRVICHEMGCPMAVSEMVSAKGYLLSPKGNRAAQELLSVDESEKGAVALQLFGHEPDVMARAAEELIFHSITTGASNDIEQATKLARALVTRYGMTEDFDMVALETVNNAYLGGDASLACSEQTAAQVDAKVVEIVQAEHKKAYQMLADNKRKLDEIAQYLYEKETISGEEFMRILNAQPQLPAGPSADSTNQAQ